MITETHAVRIPLRVTFRRVDSRTALLIRGEAGWGEFSPFPEYPPQVTAWWWRAAQEAATEGWPAPLRNAIPVNTTVPAMDPERAHAMVRASGCRTAKVKVAERGQSLAHDEARVEAVRDALGPDGHVRVDANAAWDADQAVAALRVLDRAAGGLQYAEQPCSTLEEMAAVRRRIDVPLAADESIRTAEDPLRVAGLEAADVVVVKVQPLGGVRRALRVVEAAGLPAVVSSAIETSVGLAAGAALAAALPELPYACGLGTATLLEGDVTHAPRLPVDGRIPVGPVEVNDGLVEEWAAPPSADIHDRYLAAAAAVGAAASDGHHGSGGREPSGSDRDSARGGPAHA
ncbi:o-succinylbenzoate synthase [Euzebya tangerina]|uniref:o-succinylbenzoate synthase n=1 Tax=Euzebya tangerina TaxID=591198 RepID=UPI000E30BC03|nr:o-succinylbenzoate synthase [Euzebya tangerina]